MPSLGLKDGKPYEIFTGLADEEIFPIPKTIVKGKIIKNKDDEGNTTYDFQYTDKYGYKNTMGDCPTCLNLNSGIMPNSFPEFSDMRCR